MEVSCVPALQKGQSVKAYSAQRSWVDVLLQGVQMAEVCVYRALNILSLCLRMGAILRVSSTASTKVLFCSAARFW